MKVIEAMKRVKANKEKITDLQQKVMTFCANLSFETHAYPDPRGKIEEWLQSATDLSKENVRLLVAIARTNLATEVTITIEGTTVTRPVAYWIWRRREYAAIDGTTWSRLTDRGLKESNIQNTTGGDSTKVTIVRHFDPEIRDRRVAAFKSEPHEIDAALEVSNAVTDLME